MYTVMLVDDEHHLRAGLRKHIPWERHGFQVTTEAASGLEALRLFRAQPADLIMLDIKMPGMSGFELLDALLRSGFQAHVVILSGYGEFEFARQALKYTVVDYLLKPVKVQEVAELLDKIRESLDRRREQTVQLRLQQRTQLENEWFKLLNGGGETESAGAFAELLFRANPRATCRVAYAAMANDQSGDAAEQAIRGHFAPAGGELLIAEAVGYGYGLLFVADDREERPSEEEWQLKAMALPASCPSLRACVFGASFRQADGFAPFAAETRAGLERELFYSAFPVAFARQAYRFAASAAGCPWSGEQREQWRELVRGGDPEAVRRWLKEAQRKLQDAAFAPDSVRASYADMLRVAGEVRDKRSGAFRPDAGGVDSAEAAQRFAREAIRLQELHEQTERLALAALQRESSGRDPGNRLVHQLKQHIRDHLAEPVSLTDLAVSYGVTHEYLSMLFKREEKVNFHHYLKTARMNRAMAIMQRDPLLKIYEVAYQVGYTDAKHFSKVFRECTGQTPKEYAEKVHR
ncbi:MAG: response regulator [Paenibacillaceae bacterium]|nr:response regulator [Paenibacillaceae bacterium]